MHRILALKFAAWLDPGFEVWVFKTIDQLLYPEFNALRTATLEKVKYKNELESKKKALLEKHPEDFREFLELEEKLNQAEKTRNKALRSNLKQLTLDFQTINPN